MDRQDMTSSKAAHIQSKGKNELWLAAFMVQKEILKMKRTYASLESTIREIESEQAAQELPEFAIHRSTELHETREELWDVRLKLESLMFMSGKISTCAQGISN